MKKNKFFAYLLLMLPALMLQSCLKDQEDKFNDPSAIRMQNYLQDAQKVLTDNKSGWLLNYYPHKERIYGGYAYALNFTQDSVYVESEEYPDVVVGSLYTMTTDNGPMLSFDTYNALMHKYATPSSARYEAYGGDFEFIIMSATPEKVVLKGKRSGNMMTMTPLTMDAQEYFAKTRLMRESVELANYSGDGLQVDFDLESYSVTFPGEENPLTTSYHFTPEGIGFYEPIEWGGATYNGFTYDIENQTMAANGKVMKGQYPEGWKTIDELEGTYQWKAKTITAVKNEAGDGFVLTGISEDFLVSARYSKAAGSMTIPTQFLSTYSKYVIWLTPCDGSSLTWDTDVVFKGKNSFDDDGNLVITFTNKDYPTFWEMAFTGDSPSEDGIAGYWDKWDSPIVLTKVK